MKRIAITSAALGLMLAGANVWAASAPSTQGASASAKVISCHLTFSMSGWSAFYKTASGKGIVKCDNGQTLPVKISLKGGGLTFGKSSIKDGRGVFSGVYNIREVLGHYGFSQAHAGAVKEANAMALTKGSVSLALTGLGRGWSLGVDFGAFIIEPSSSK
ncbi:MAG: hypothetical protein WCB49_13795 [Gammaproteobacteria bacterium]